MGGFRFSGSPRSFPLRVGKRAKAKAVTKAMDDLGLKPFVPSEPLPPISTDEVHLICWLAVETEKACGSGFRSRRKASSL